ncbi:uncharacterized protein C6orf136 homolog [Dryobates pubescens]|uniref:uncharacterized protein C6orf136 homolog n=1 Tax=Dryobates pubescens TaxID=118200 RepID=UPI0023B9D7A6|nr:uncharacterized protein C6orf136 homolog [Dryobates pubescens]
MFRHGSAAAAAASRLRPAASLRAWAPLEAAGAGPQPQRRRYRARPQDLEPPPRGHLLPPPWLPPSPRLPPGGPRGQFLSPPEGLGGAITTVAARQDDDIAVRDGTSPSPSPPHGAPFPHPPHLLLLLSPSPNPWLAPAGGPQPPAPPQPSMEEHLAVMHQKLQHELPNFFLKVPDYGLYSLDVEFINPPLRIHTRGRPMYQLAVALCRVLAWGYFASLRLELLALTRHPEDGTIRARWRLTGLPLHLLLLRFYRRDKRALLRSFDAFSTFTLNPQGLICCHRVDKLMPAPRALPEAKKLLVAAGGGLAAATLVAPPGTSSAPQPQA